jgi:histidinol dehydrogenase
VRIISFQEVSPAGLKRIAPPAIVLAEAEGLLGHAESLRVRCAHA